MSTSRPDDVRAPRTTTTSTDRTSRTPSRTLAAMVNVVTAYQRIHLRLDAHTLTIDTPVAWLGVVPHGRRVIDVPRREILDARIAPAVFPSRLLAAIVLAAVPWLVKLPVILAVTCSVAAVLFLLLSVVASIRIDTIDGARFVIPVCWFERRAVGSLLADVEEDMP